jgi:hypothetical protein
MVGKAMCADTNLSTGVAMHLYMYANFQGNAMGKEQSFRAVENKR